jgi:hypothetical protein
MLEDLRSTWDRQDREKAGPAFPMVPEVTQQWLDVEGFRERLELAVERHRHDELRFAVHRLEFADASEAFSALVARLPGQIRDTDCICRPGARVVLLLTAGPAVGFLHLRRRVLALWEQAWHEARLAAPPPPITDQRIELQSPEDAETFLVTAGRWLASRN